MTTLQKIRENHVQVIKEFLPYTNLEEGTMKRMTERILTARIGRLHHHWFASSSKRERYKELERSVV